ncbi:class F sortase [Micromonospora zamorensis]|uniref:class F sortase n=1 Tax=Micromonospora zamorensis TaxID=709883 RepID=UPI00081FC10A|nr:class F sortase [Micromonospora zamorensis]WTE88851.1 class F sortase [Micromonospora zamorensis]SCG48731.1 Sortase family protein [Micromonospora zamorensis]
MWWRRTLPAVVALLGVTGLGLITVGLTADPARPPRPPADAPRRTHPAPDLAPLSRAAPVRVQITAIGVRAEVVGVGADAAGVLEVPPLDKPTLAGWYRHGVSPGETGNAVLVGHVDSPAGPAVFFDLGRLRAGEQIQVTRADAQVATFTVDDVQAYPKDRFPSTLVYGPADAAGLRLITCGGRFDASTGNYVDNIVVFATRTA